MITAIVINLSTVATGYAFLSRETPYSVLMLVMITLMFSLVMAVVAVFLVKNLFDEALKPPNDTTDNLSENTHLKADNSNENAS